MTYRPTMKVLTTYGPRWRIEIADHGAITFIIRDTDTGDEERHEVDGETVVRALRRIAGEAMLHVAGKADLCEHCSTPLVGQIKHPGVEMWCSGCGKATVYYTDDAGVDHEVDKRGPGSCNACGNVNLFQDVITLSWHCSSCGASQ